MGSRQEGRTRHAGEFALTPSEVDTLLSKVEDPRDLALLTLAVATGMRRNDIVRLRTDALNMDDPERSSVTFHEAKKDRTRTVGVSAGARQSLLLYLKGRPTESVWLFPSPTRPRAHISSRAAWDILNRWLDRANLLRRPFHSLRATCYKLAKARGWSLEQAAAQIGDTIRVAQEFYGVATAGELMEVARAKPII